MKIELPQRTMQCRRRENLPNGGFTTHADGTETIGLVAEIDAEKLAAWCAEKAWRSKKGVTRVAGGAIKVSVTTRVRKGAACP